MYIGITRIRNYGKNLKVFVVQFTHRQGRHGIISTDSSLYASKADAIGRLKEYRQEYIEDNQIKMISLIFVLLMIQKPNLPLLTMTPTNTIRSKLWKNDTLNDIYEISSRTLIPRD